MILNIVVHDLFNEIGHSKAMIEVLKAMGKEDLKHLHVVCYTHDSKEKLFPHFSGQVTFSTVPGANLKPFILKSLFFQLYTFLFKRILTVPNAPIITIGVCSFIGDIVNVQFVHRLWSPLYFTINQMSPLKYLYKKILLGYLDLCEVIYYNFKKPHLVCLSQFIANDFKQRYNYPDHLLTTAYSSASLTDFGPGTQTRHQLFTTLVADYPQLQALDLDRPIFLFVGAYERKGLPLILDSLDDEQLIIIGKAEGGSQLTLPTHQHLYPIAFTNKIASFFNLCDCFIFPTQYEPFGLVVLEAAASGANIIVTKERVGASELLEQATGVSFCHGGNLKELIKQQRILSPQQRQSNYQQRMSIFEQYSWEKAAQRWLLAIKNTPA